MHEINLTHAKFSSVFTFIKFDKRGKQVLQFSYHIYDCVHLQSMKQTELGSIPNTNLSHHNN